MSTEIPSTLGERTPIADAHFSVEARLAIQLGRESISSSITAILELVKNAYDADATKVSIRFKGLETPDPMMVIEDNGVGMTLDELQHYWMVIACASAPLRSVAPGKRRSQIQADDPRNSAA